MRWPCVTYGLRYICCQVASTPLSIVMKPIGYVGVIVNSK
jgi:hypothetical protein